MLRQAGRGGLLRKVMCMLIVPPLDYLPCERPAGQCAASTGISQDRADVGPPQEAACSTMPDDCHIVPSNEGPLASGLL